MIYLLDTHTFIWGATASSKLSARAYAIFQDKTNMLLVSLATVWEMQIKLQLGKLELPKTLPEILEDQQQINQIESLPILLPHILALGGLPSHHRDPFDRLLIAQAQIENIAIISHDPVFAKYLIPVIW